MEALVRVWKPMSVVLMLTGEHNGQRGCVTPDILRNLSAVQLERVPGFNGLRYVPLFRFVGMRCRCSPTQMPRTEQRIRARSAWRSGFGAWIPRTIVPEDSTPNQPTQTHVLDRHVKNIGFATLRTYRCMSSKPEAQCPPSDVHASEFTRPEWNDHRVVTVLRSAGL